MISVSSRPIREQLPNHLGHLVTSSWWPSERNYWKTNFISRNSRLFKIKFRKLWLWDTAERAKFAKDTEIHRKKTENSVTKLTVASQKESKQSQSRKCCWSMRVVYGVKRVAKNCGQVLREVSRGLFSKSKFCFECSGCATSKHHSMLVESSPKQDMLWMYVLLMLSVNWWALLRIHEHASLPPDTTWSGIISKIHGAY